MEHQSVVAQWLAQLGLERYIALFEDNDIDQSLLPALDHELLKEIGISSVGHRLKILKASQTLDGGQAEAVGTVEPRALDSAQSDPVVDTKSSGATPENVQLAHSSARHVTEAGERKHITVMFCDMVGSTRLSTLYDPEDYTVIIKDFHAACTAVIHRYGGYVARYMGDGILAYFGYPQSHENNAERAIRSALEMVSQVTSLKPRPDLQLQSRVGIATGLVVIGEKVAGAASESVASGDTPNLAARLQSIAEPDQVVVSDSTRHLCGGLFQWTTMGEHILKGFADPVPAFSVAAGDLLESRFSATRHKLESGIVGRDLEVALLHDRWRSAQGGDGQMVLVTGEAGLGKSRLVHEAIVQLADEPLQQANLQCSPYHVESALYPLVDYFSRRSGLQPSDDENTRREKLLATFKASGSPSDVDLALLLQLSGTKWSADSEVQLPTSAEHRKQRTLDLLLGWFVRLSREQPLLVVLEDVHWMDPTTHAFMLQLLDALPEVPLLIIATARPSLTYDFGGYTAVSQLSLNRLSATQMNDIVSLMTGGKSLPSTVAAGILNRADGIPLYVEELTRYVLESGQLEEHDDGYRLIGLMQQINIPATLYDSLSARLDRLGNAKEIAQVGAVIGREFNFSLLQAVLNMPEEDLYASLLILMNIGLLARKSRDDGTSYLFKHALMRDAAYQGLLYSQRRHWHQRIASVIVEKFPTVAQTQPELLAQHYSDGAMIEQALVQWHHCASKNLEKFNNLEAAEQAGHGLTLLASCTDQLPHVKIEIDLQLAVAYALRNSEGYSAPGSESAFARAFDLAGAHRDHAAMSASAAGLCSAYHVGGKMQKAYDIALLLGENTDSAELLLDSRWLLGQTLYSLGDQQLALQKYDEAFAERALRDKEGAVNLRDKIFDPYCASWQYMQRCELLLGNPDRADELCNKAVARAFELDQPTAKCATLIGHCLHLQRTARDPSAQANSLQTITDHHQVRYWRAWTDYCNAVAAMFHGSFIEAERLLVKSIASHQEMNSLMGMPTILATMGEVYQHQRLFDKAMDSFDQAIAVVNQTGERCDEPELHRLRAECLLLQNPGGNADEAIRGLQKSLSISRQQKTRWWELLAASSYARLLLAQGDREQANRQLAPVFSGLTQGLELEPYRHAKQLMAQCEKASV